MFDEREKTRFCLGDLFLKKSLRHFLFFDRKFIYENKIFNHFYKSSKLKCSKKIINGFLYGSTGVPFPKNIRQLWRGYFDENKT